MAKKMRCYKCDGTLERTKDKVEVLEGSGLQASRRVWII
jgi:hypothetical protein